MDRHILIGFTNVDQPADPDFFIRFLDSASSMIFLVSQSKGVRRWDTMARWWWRIERIARGSHRLRVIRVDRFAE